MRHWTGMELVGRVEDRFVRDCNARAAAERTKVHAERRHDAARRSIAPIEFDTSRSLTISGASLWLGFWLGVLVVALSQARVDSDWRPGCLGAATVLLLSFVTLRNPR